MPSKIQMMAAALGGPKVGCVGGLTLAAATASGSTDLLGGAVIPSPCIIRLCCDAAWYFVQGPTGLAAPVAATPGAPGTAGVAQLVPANTFYDVTVNGPADQFINAISTPGGNLRWSSRSQLAPTQ